MTTNRSIKEDIDELRAIGATLVTARNIFESKAYNANRCGSLPVLNGTPCLTELDEYGECPQCDTSR